MGAPIPIYHYFVCKHKFVVPLASLLSWRIPWPRPVPTIIYYTPLSPTKIGTDSHKKIRRFSFGVPLFWPHFFMNLRLYNNNEFIQLFEPRSPLSTHVNKAHLLLHPSHARIILASLGCYVLLTVFRAY